MVEVRQVNFWVDPEALARLGPRRSVEVARVLSRALEEGWFDGLGGGPHRRTERVGKVRLSVRLPLWLLRHLKVLAALRDVSVNYLVDEALRRWREVG